MKNKWLLGITTAALGVTLALGFAACGGKKDGPSASDADIVADMTDTLNLMYADESPLTPVSYSVTHSVTLSGKEYAVDWSVEAVTEGITISEFVEVGTVDEAKNTTAIEIKKTSQVVDYKLNGSFTVGKETGSVSFDRQIPLIYSVAEVKELVNGFSNQQYYKVDNEVVEVVVKGYVVDTGEWASKYNNFQKVYIADSPTETNSANRCQVYGLILDNVYLTKQEDLVEGAEIIVAGALQYYRGPEITFYNDKNIKPRALYYKLPDLSDEDIVDRALAKLSIPSTFIKEGTYTLPTELEDAAITWAVTTGSEYAAVSGGTLTLSNLPAPASPAEVVLTATVSCGEVHKDKGITVKVYKSNIVHEGTQADPYTPAEALELAQTLTENSYYEVDGAVADVYVKGKAVSFEWAGETYKNFNNVYLIEESAYTAEATKDSDGVFMVYRIKKNNDLPSESSLLHGDTLVVKGNIQNYNGDYQLGHSGDTTSSSELVSFTSSMTSAQKVEAVAAEAKAAIPTTLTADFDLPTSRFADVTLTFTSDKQNVIKVESGKLTVTRPTDADATVTITVKATCGTDEKSETVSVTVPKQLVIPQDAVKATVTIATYADAHNWVKETINDNGVIDIDTNIKVTSSGTASSFGLNTGKYYDKNESWRIYKTESPILKFEAKNGAKILTIKVTYEFANTGVLTSADKKVIYASDEKIEVGATEISFTVDQTGTEGNGNIQITAIEVVYSGGTELGPEDKLSAAVTALTLSKTTFTEIGEEVELPATGLNGTTIQWEVAENTYFTNADGKLTVKALPATGAADATVQVTAKVSIAGVEAPTSKVFTLTVKAPIEEVYTQLEAATAGDYILGLYQGTLKKWLFSTGVINTSNFGETTENIAGAAVFTLTSVEGGWTIQLKSNNKYLELNSSHRLTYVDSRTQAWKWNDTYKVFTFDVSGETYYIGAYNTFNTFSASKVSFLGSDSNFPAKFGSVELTDEQMQSIIDTELNAVEATLSVAKEGDVVLAASTNSKVTFSWALKAENTFPEGTTLDNCTLKVESLPTEEAIFTLVLTATYEGSEVNKSKDVTVTITAAPKSDDDKVAQAKSTVELDDTLLENDGDTITLPTTSGDVTISWAIQGDTSEYIDLQDNTVSVKKFPDDADKEVTLVATFSLNEAHDTKDFTITVKRHINYGTEEAPISVAAALAIAEDECGTESGAWTEKQIYATGKVKNTATVSGQEWKEFTIVDLEGSEEILVYKMAAHATLHVPTQNDTIVLYGWIEYFNSTYEFTGYTQQSKDNPVLISRTAGQSTITLGAHDGADVTGFEGNTATATNDSTFTFTVTAQAEKRVDAVKVNGNTVDATEGTTYEFTVAGNATVTVEASDASAPAAETLKFDFSVNKTVDTTALTDTTAKAFFDSAASNSDLLTSVTDVVKIFKGNNNGGYTTDATGTLKMGASKNGTDGSFTLTFTKNVTKVVVEWAGWSTSEGDLTVDGTKKTNHTTTKTTSEWEIASKKAISFESTKRLGIYTITVTFAAE